MYAVSTMCVYLRSVKFRLIAILRDHKDDLTDSVINNAKQRNLSHMTLVL